MKLKNYKYLLLILLFSCSRNVEQNFHLFKVDLPDYYFFNEILLDENTEFLINFQRDTLKIRNRNTIKSYSFFYNKNENKANVIKEDMVITLYDIQFNNDTMSFRTKWLPEGYSINWKEEYWTYKRDGIQFLLIRDK